MGIAVAGPAAAQDVAVQPFLIINQERLLTGSRAGQQLLDAEERERDKLRTEARALDASFEAEERQLTEQRSTLPPVEFRGLADAFDARVVQARRDQDARASALADDFEQRRRQFYARVAPLLVSLMDRYRAKAVFDESSVLVADQSLNITDAVIAEIDAEMGAAVSPGPAPETVPGVVPPDPATPDAVVPAPEILRPRAPAAPGPGIVLPPHRGAPGDAPDGGTVDGGE
jgi:Skp family chaperone for outer membrane proteins